MKEPMKFDLPPGTEFLVCHESAVHQVGYRLVAIIPTEEIVELKKMTYEHRHGVVFATEGQQERMQTVRYLMVRDADAVKEELRSSLSAARDKYSVAVREASAKDQERRELKRDLAQATSDLDTLQKRVLSDEETIRETARATQRLEDDIGKIRGAVGELKMKEILGR